MTTDEFKEQFKVGDKVSGPTWRKESSIEILHIGGEKFLGLDSTGEMAFPMADDWIPFKQEDKPLELQEGDTIEPLENPELRYIIDFVGDLETKTHWKDQEYIVENRHLHEGNYRKVNMMYLFAVKMSKNVMSELAGKWCVSKQFYSNNLECLEKELFISDCKILDYTGVEI
jgi:hypothetical protein